MRHAMKTWALGLCAACAAFAGQAGVLPGGAGGGLARGLQAAFSRGGARAYSPIAEGGGVSLGQEYKRDSTFNKWSE